MHDDVTKSITVQELQRTKEEFMCHTTHALYDEMEFWELKMETPRLEMRMDAVLEDEACHEDTSIGIGRKVY